MRCSFSFRSLLLSFGLLASSLLRAEPNSGGNNAQQPTNHQAHPETPTGAGGACCCCCPPQQTYSFDKLLGIFRWLLPAYPGVDISRPADPVVISSGKNFIPYVDVAVPGPGRYNAVNIAFSRAYNNRSNFIGVAGWGWHTNLDIALSFSGSTATFRDSDGSEYFLKQASSITYADGTVGPGYHHGQWTLKSPASYQYVLTKSFGTKYLFQYTAGTWRLSWIEDRQGHRVSYNRDTSGRITSLTDSTLPAQTINFVYHGTGKLWKVTGPLGRVWEYLYSGDNLWKVIAPLSRTTTYGYTDIDAHNLTSITDPHGRTISYQYTSGADPDRVNRVDYPDGTNEQFIYLPYLNQSTFTDRAGQLWQYTYVDPGMVQDVTDPNGYTWHYEYSAQKKMTLMRDPAGDEMRWTWDARENLTGASGWHNGTQLWGWTIGTSPSHHFPLAVTDAEGHVTPAPVYNSQMSVTSFQDALNHTTVIDYGVVGSTRPDEVFDRNGTTLSYSWHPNGALISHWDGGASHNYTWDAAGRINTVSRSGTPLVQYFYDDADRVTSIQRAGVTIQTWAYVDSPQSVTVTVPGHATTTTFDSGGRVYEVAETGYTLPTRYEYSGPDRIWRVRDPAGRTVEQLYHSNGALWKIIEPPAATGGSSLVTEYNYHPNGELASLQDPGGHLTQFAFNPFTRRLTTTFPDNTVEIKEMDRRGLMVQFTNRAGQARNKAYDAARRLISQDCPTCGASFKYDNEGRLIFVNDANAGDGNPLTDDFAFEYDGGGRLLAAKQPGPGNIPRAVTVSYTYDLAGRLKTQKWPDGSTATYDYDTAGRFWKITRGTSVWTYTYSANDSRDRLTLSNGTSGQYYYDGAERLETLTWTSSTGTLLNYNEYVWNSANELAEYYQTNGLDGARTFTYDGISRLKSSTPSGSLFSGDLPRTWNYDANGNRTSVTTGPMVENYTPKAGEWNLYDTVNGLTQTYDANKNLTSDGVLSMVYDADNRMTSLSKSGLSESMVYDWMGRLIKKTVNTATTRYYYSGWTVLAEVNEAGGATLHRYVHGPRIDELLSDETGGTSYHLLSDHLGSTTAVVTGTSTVAQRYTYDPYGTPTIRNAAGTPIATHPITNYLYTGREYDLLSGLYNYRHRVYHPRMGRFLQPDPIGFGGGLNFFSGMWESPLTLTDPFGLAPPGTGGSSTGQGGSNTGGHNTNPSNEPMDFDKMRRDFNRELRYSRMSMALGVLDCVPERYRTFCEIGSAKLLISGHGPELRMNENLSFSYFPNRYTFFYKTNNDARISLSYDDKTDFTSVAIECRF